MDYETCSTYFDAMPKRGDLGDEMGEHFGAALGAELFPNGANYGAVRLPSIRINLH